MTGTSPDWNDRYARHDTPWDTGRPSTQLRQWLTELAIAPCRALEIGGQTARPLAWSAVLRRRPSAEVN
jgi:hypothetical protein